MERRSQGGTQLSRGDALARAYASRRDGGRIGSRSTWCREGTGAAAHEDSKNAGEIQGKRCEHYVSSYDSSDNFHHDFADFYSHPLSMQLPVLILHYSILLCVYIYIYIYIHIQHIHIYIYIYTYTYN